MQFLVGVLAGAAGYWFAVTHGERFIAWVMGKIGGQ